MGVEIKQAVVEALKHRLFPVMARWLLQAGVSVQEATDLLRVAAIAEALKSIPEGISPDSISLVSIRTGLSRRLIRESLAAEQSDAPEPPGGGGHRGERVLAGWWHDPDFRDERGHPRILPVSGGSHSFEALVRRYSGERQHRTVLRDLEQVGAVAVLEPGDRAQVLRRSYAAAGWTEAGQAAMAEQIAEHIETCLHNIKHPAGSQHLLCRRVSNAQVRPEHAHILVRNIRSHVESQADIVYDTLTDPQYTADPLDAQSEQIVVTFYMTRISNSSGGRDLSPSSLDESATVEHAVYGTTATGSLATKSRRHRTKPKSRK